MADTVQMISPQDMRVYTVKAGQEGEYKNAGYVPVQSNIDQAQIHEHFSGWAGAGKSFLFSTLHGIPFATAAYSAVTDKEHAEWLQEQYAAAEREHPLLDVAGRLTGGAAAIYGAGAAVGALGLGAGAAAAAGGAEAAGLGAEAAGAVGAGAEAIGAGAAEAPLLSFAAPTIRGAAVKGAVASAALGHIARIDDSALAHAADPEGKEKIQWGLNENDLIDAAFGAAVPVALGTVGKTLGYLGKQLNSKGLGVIYRAMTKAGSMAEMERQGRLGDVQQKLTQVIEQNRENPYAYVASQVKIAGNDMESLKAKIGYASLDHADTAAVKESLYKSLGKDNRVYRRIRSFLDKEAWTVDDMQKLNEKIYKEVEFNEIGQRAEENAAYLDAADQVKKGMLRVFQLNDPTSDQQMAQSWAIKMKQYSDWSLLKSIVKRNHTPATLMTTLSRMASGGATGFLSGTLFGAFGGPINAAGSSAAYAAVNSIEPTHYGRAMIMLGKAFKGVDSKLTSAVEAGLYGAPALIRNLHPRSDYGSVASKLSAIRQDPETAFVNIRTALQEQGIPEHMADDGALAAHTQIQWLASKLPSRMTAPDVATRGHGDPQQQRRLMGQYQSLKDPTYAILYPTKSNLEVLQRFYPNILMNTQQAVLSQLQRNPNLPATSKSWASRILGRPINNLSSPSFSAMLNRARQQGAQQEQGSMPSRRQNKLAPSDAGTELDRLQGGGE